MSLHYLFTPLFQGLGEMHGFPLTLLLLLVGNFLFGAGNRSPIGACNHSVKTRMVLFQLEKICLTSKPLEKLMSSGKKKIPSRDHSLFVLSPGPLRQTPLRSYGCHKAASGPAPSLRGQSPATESKLSGEAGYTEEGSRSATEIK